MSNYQGWSNRSTFVVNLWFTTDGTMYEWANNHKDNLANDLEQLLEETMPELIPPWGSLLDIAFEEVNWKEIADTWLDHAPEDNTYKITYVDGNSVGTKLAAIEADVLARDYSQENDVDCLVILESTNRVVAIVRNGIYVYRNVEAY